MNDFLQYALDVMNKKAGDVGLDDLAPEPTEETAKLASGAPYIAQKDPEILDEALQNRKIRLALREARRGDRVAAYANAMHHMKKKPTYEDYMDSEFSAPNDSEKGFKSDLAWLTKEGFIGTDKKFNVSGGKGYAGHGGLKTSKQGPVGPYEIDRPEEYEAGDYSKQVDALSSKYGAASIKTTAEEMFQDVFNVVKNIILRRTDKRHAIVYGDPGIGKTYEVTSVCERFIGQSPIKARYVYEKGDIGSAMSALVPFFYHHSHNAVIVLDDNDKMIMKNLEQDIMNIMKAILDPVAEDKPITVRGTMMKAFQARYDDLLAADAEEEDKKAAKREGKVFEVDADALRENRFILKINNEIIVDKHISLQESHKLQNQMIPIREKEETYVNPYAKSLKDYSRRNELREVEIGKFGTNKELLDDLIGGDDDSEYEGMTAEDKRIMKQMKADGATEFSQEGDGSFPRKFTFSSSVIFVSNLEMNDINNAVLDRVTGVEVKLNLDQFLERLGKIYGALGKMRAGTSVDPSVRKWAKECTYTLIGIVIEAWKANKPLWGAPVEINRKMTFRMFDEFVAAWEMYAMDLCERNYGKSLNVADKTFMNKLSQDLIPVVLKRKCIPWLKTHVKS